MRRAFLLFLVIASVAHAERINQEGRILGPAPVVSQPILFNTPAADAIVSAMQIMPRENPWNEDISRRPVHANSDPIIAQITSDLSTARRTLRPFYEMNYVLVPDAQPRVTIPFSITPTNPTSTAEFLRTAATQCRRICQSRRGRGEPAISLCTA